MPLENALRFVQILVLNQTFIALLFGCHYSGAAEARVAIKATTSTLTSAAAGSSFPATKSHSDERTNISASEGPEVSECQAHGRKSFARSQAEARLLSNDPSGAAVVMLRASVNARGGHYRNCITCGLNRCVGILPEDTIATAQAVANAIVSVSIGSDLKRFRYALRILVSNENGDLQIAVNSSAGNRIDPIPGDARAYILTEAIRDVTVKLTASADVADKGGCCSATKAVAGRVEFRVEPAPLIDSTYAYEPFVRGGKYTNSYKNVVAIGYNGKLHCSGTFIGSKAILTAAHCIYDYEKEIAKGRFDVRFGDVYSRPEKTFPVVSGRVPKGEIRGFKFNPATYEDDVGILLLAQAPAYAVASAHKGIPKWEAIVSDGLPLIIVGFGFNVIGNEMIGTGIKREAVIKVDSVSNRQAVYGEIDANACNGDSGGPAFIEQGGNLVLVSITSGGDEACTNGVNIRYDALMPWIEAQLN